MLAYQKGAADVSAVCPFFNSNQKQNEQRKMTVYVIIAFLCIIIGMVISVSCFGTKGKTPKVFKDIYFSIEDIDGAGILYTKTGEFSAILAMQNPVQKHCADIDNYYGFSNLLAALMATLGDGYSIHKQDVFTRRQFKCEDEGNKEFLSESYFRYFGGRRYTDCTTYITITQENKKSKIKGTVLLVCCLFCCLISCALQRLLHSLFL